MERLQYLLQRRLDGTLTAAEEAELAEASPAELAEIMANLIEAEPHIPVDEETLQHSFQRLMLRDRIIERPRRYYSLMASIAALFALAIAGWFLLRKPEPVRIVTPFAVAPIIPGGNKAVLTLANGRQIVLDSAGNGDLAQEGGVRVVKMDSGLLSYRGSGGTSAAGEYNTLSTPRGGQYQLVLPDGTRVWLNSASSLRYPLSFTSGREVELTGEAYFDVARNAGSPFVVKAPHSRVEVLGTAFNLMAYPDESHTRTTLINGAVKVVQGGFSTIIWRKSWHGRTVAFNSAIPVSGPLCVRWNAGMTSMWNIAGMWTRYSLPGASPVNNMLPNCWKCSRWMEEYISRRKAVRSS